MDELLGQHIEEARFQSFLSSWQSELAIRTKLTVDGISKIPGVEGLILAGSNGRGQPWPLSDIDLIPVYANEQIERTKAQVERIRLQLMTSWQLSGWRTGVDVGNLFFTVGEIRAQFMLGQPCITTVLTDNRWYHAIDKAYLGSVTTGEAGREGRLLQWINSMRFSDAVVKMRLSRSIAESKTANTLAKSQAHEGNLIASYGSLLKSIQWLQIHYMESWGMRDNSQGRFGTRFEDAAYQRGLGKIAAQLNEFASLTDLLVEERMRVAPPWVKERNDRSWKSRRAIAEDVTQTQSERDVLRVCTIYELRVLDPRQSGDSWLGIPEYDDLIARSTKLGAIVSEKL